jgi:hypothetical protein
MVVLLYVCPEFLIFEMGADPGISYDFMNDLAYVYTSSLLCSKSHATHSDSAEVLK